MSDQGTLEFGLPHFTGFAVENLDRCYLYTQQVPKSFGGDVILLDVCAHRLLVLAFGPPEGNGPIRCPLSVSMYVCHSCSALTTPTNMLKFGLKVGDH